MGRTVSNNDSDYNYGRRNLRAFGANAWDERQAWSLIKSRKTPAEIRSLHFYADVNHIYNGGWLEVHEIITGWNEDTVTWNTRPSIGNLITVIYIGDPFTWYTLFFPSGIPTLGIMWKTGLDPTGGMSHFLNLLSPNGRKGDSPYFKFA